jgi:P27 family predicted phage terminase small subunit
MTTKAPTHLTKASRDWFRDVTDRYELRSEHVRLLTHACECWDRAAQAREIIDREGVTIETAHGVRAHPAIRIERDNKKLFASLVSQLSLDAAEAEVLTQYEKDCLRLNARMGGWKGQSDEAN